MTADEILRTITLEIQNNSLVATTWTQAFAEADGDEGKAKARYIRLRQAQLQTEANVSRPRGTPPTATEVRPPAARSAVEVRREMLAKRLDRLGRSSLYANIGLAAAADDVTVTAAVTKLRDEEALGRILSAEERYALQTLGDPRSRESYDRNLLEQLDRLDEQAYSLHEREPSGRGLWYLGAVLAALALAAYATHSHNQEQSRREIALEMARAKERAAKAEAEAREKRAEMEQAAAAEAAQQAAQLAQQQQGLRQQLVESQTRTRAAQVELQREQMEERKKQAAWHREQADQLRKERQEQEKARRTVQQAERDLCTTARRSNNVGQVVLWCR